MLTMLGTRLGENPLVEIANLLVKISYLGPTSDKQLLLCLQQKQNTSQQLNVALSFSG
jgi:hypothetical protein